MVSETRQLVRTFLAPLVILALGAPALSQSGSEQRGKPPAGRYWLDTEYRRGVAEYEKRRDALQQVRALDIAGVKPGMTVGEVGAGNGYYTLKLAHRVGPSGKVYANDIVENFLAELRDRAREQGFSNIETILGTETDPRLPAGRLDFVFLVQVLHDLARPTEVLEKIALSLKPGAKVVVVENEGGKSCDGDRVVVHTRQYFLDIIARSRFSVERIDTSLPDPRSVVFVLSDPVVVEKLISEISKKREMLEAKRGEIADPVQQQKLQQELDMLAKKQHELQALLAELKGVK